MPGLLDVYTRRAEALASGLRSLDRGTATSFQFEGTTYTATTREAADLQYELYLLKAAREAILAGAQSHTILGRTFQQADLREVSQQLRRLEAELGRATRGGIRTRTLVPLG